MSEKKLDTCFMCNGDLRILPDGLREHVNPFANHTPRWIEEREPVASPQAARPDDASVRREAFKEVEAFIAGNGRNADIQSFVEMRICQCDAAQPAARTTPLIESDLKDAVMFLRIVLTRKDMTALNCLKPKIADWLKRRGYKGSILRETE